MTCFPALEKNRHAVNLINTVPMQTRTRRKTLVGILSDALDMQWITLRFCNCYASI